MKSMKKLIALMLAVVMVFAMGITALAGSSEEDGTGSITIANKVDGSTYGAYKILSVTYADGTKADGAFSYTIKSDSPWKATVESFFTLEAAASDSTVFVATPNEGFDAATFAAALSTALNEMDPKPEATTLSGAGEEDLELGYWFVTTTTGSVCNLTTTHPDSMIYDKNRVDFDKDEDEELPLAERQIVGSAQIGDKVPYKIEGRVPSTTGFKVYKYIVSDTLTGADYNKDVVVKFGTTTITPSAQELVETAAGFTLTFDMTKYQQYVNQDITITYSGTVNDSSLKAGEVVNTAVLEHSYDPTKSTETKPEPEIIVLTKVFTLDLSKVAEDKSTPLAGAQFVLQNKDNGKYYSAIAKNGIDGKGKPYTTIYDVEWVDRAGALVVTTDENGKGDAEFAGLIEGTYELVEVKSPAGYNLPKDPFEIVITKNGEKVVSLDEETGDITKEYTYEATIQGPYDEEAQEVNINDISCVATVIENHSGALLPETGGFGTTMLIVLGSVLFLATAIVLVTKKRMYNAG